MTFTWFDKTNFVGTFLLPSSDSTQMANVLTSGSNNNLPDMHLWMFGLLDLSECQAKCFRISSTNAITYNSNVTFCHIPEGHLKFLWQLDTRATSADGYQREWSSYCDSPDKLARPLSGCASSRSVADLAPWGWRTSQWLDGWLVLASEQKCRFYPSN